MNDDLESERQTRTEGDVATLKTDVLDIRAAIGKLVESNDVVSEAIVKLEQNRPTPAKDILTTASVAAGLVGALGTLVFFMIDARVNTHLILANYKIAQLEQALEITYHFKVPKP